MRHSHQLVGHHVSRGCGGVLRVRWKLRERFYGGAAPTTIFGNHLICACVTVGKVPASPSFPAASSLFSISSEIHKWCYALDP